MPHPNSLMYNAYPIPFWPMKVYWTLKKVRLTRSRQSESYCIISLNRQLPLSWSETSPLLLRITLMPRSAEPMSLFQDSIIEREIMPLFIHSEKRVSLTIRSPFGILWKSLSGERLAKWVYLIGKRNLKGSWFLSLIIRMVHFRYLRVPVSMLFSLYNKLLRINTSLYFEYKLMEDLTQKTA